MGCYKRLQALFLLPFNHPPCKFSLQWVSFEKIFGQKKFSTKGIFDMKTTRVTILLSDSTIDPVKKSNLPLFLVRVFGQSTRESRDGKVGMHDTRPKENPRFRNMLARAISHPGNILPREARFLSTPSLTLPKKTDENTTSESRHFCLSRFFDKAAF